MVIKMYTVTLQVDNQTYIHTEFFTQSNS